VRGADDSKKLSEKRREALFEEIKEKSLAYGISLVDNRRIDEINILQATYEAMRNALSGAIKMASGKVPGMILVDHVHIPEVEIPQMSITHGDAQSVSIASASILAKVSRDRLMKEYDEKYPEYGFAKHKGYGTKAHYAAIAEYGPSEIHRMTFLKKLYN
jgi:ribonuclease HII